MIDSKLFETVFQCVLNQKLFRDRVISEKMYQITNEILAKKLLTKERSDIMEVVGKMQNAECRMQK